MGEKSNVLSTYICEFSILPEHVTREMCMTFFGGMTDEDDVRDLGDVILLGRWSCVGEARGYCVVQAYTVQSIQKWLNNWVPMADIKVMPCLDDNDQRRLLLKHEPGYTIEYSKDTVSASPKSGESLYFIKYQFKKESVADGFNLFANLSKEDDEKDSGKCTPYGRWHIPSLACGYAIASSPSVFDIYSWAHNWNSLCDVVITPVTQDAVTREIIREGYGFSVKHAAIMNEMKKLEGSKSIFSYILSALRIV